MKPEIKKRLEDQRKKVKASKDSDQKNILLSAIDKKLAEKTVEK